MTVVEGWFSGTKTDHAPTTNDLSADFVNDLKMNICMNSKAFLTETPSGRVGYIGSSTECAMLLLLRGWGCEYNDVRTQYEKDVVQVREV
jgi:Ca2+-transporting ATPase